jgi:hypothetical protein
LVIGYLAIWLFGYLAIWLFGYLAIWLFGFPNDIIGDCVQGGHEHFELHAAAFGAVSPVPDAGAGADRVRLVPVERHYPEVHQAAARGAHSAPAQDRAQVSAQIYTLALRSVLTVSAEISAEISAEVNAEDRAEVSAPH